jgi:hypothetical protein
LEEAGMAVPRGSHFLVSLALVILLSVGIAGPVIALNPNVPAIGPPDTTFYVKDDASGLAWLFFINVLIDMSVVSGAFLVATKTFKGDVGALDRRPLKFFMIFLMAILIITAVGAFVDFYVVTELEYWNGPYNQGPEFMYHVLYFGALEWAVACSLIFGSVFGAMIGVGVRGRPSAFIAAIVTAFSPVWWLLTMQFGEDVTYLTIFFSFFTAPVLLAGLLRWQANERRAPQSMSSEASV